jgi:hypothetical protein
MHTPNQSYSTMVKVSQRLLFILAGLDIIRGIFHTYLLTWAASEVARIDPHPDAIFLLGVFGNSNFLTGALFFLIAWKAKELAQYVVGLIPLAYAIGILGIRLNGVSMQSEFNGQYMMFIYMGVCILTWVYGQIVRVKSRKLQT